ncbi:MAG TPA: selenocysteine-specific translation elongation factor [Nocardioidaceae bacterium]|nr:selenocysteine-specific translation elongation factor [Nocardioidaceae bacterium]
MTAELYVIATAGHVDHGKSTLVRALTGHEPDRWEEERRRGLTIDLGFVWTTLPSGKDVAFVDVPGHERFIDNMLAGVGPAPVVCFVVAADEGWQAQSSDHRDAIAALGTAHGVVVLTRADRAPERTDSVREQVRAELADTALRDAPCVTVTATDGSGMDELRSALDDVLSAVPTPPSTGRVRLWVDRAFTITGAGTVVTGTLGAGTVAAEDRLRLLGRADDRPVTVRGLQSRGGRHQSLGPVDRVALNLRGVSSSDVRRGDVLLTPGAWPTTRTVDVRRTTGAPLSEVPEHPTVHVGTATVPVRLRSFDDDHARLVLDRALPLVLGDRLVLRDPGGRRVLGGVHVLDADPPALTRRGDGAARAGSLARLDAAGDVGAEVARRGVVAVEHLRMLGLVTDEEPEAPDGVRAHGDWWVHRATYEAWLHGLRAAVDEAYEQNALTTGLTRGAALEALALPSEALIDPLVADAGLEQEAGRIRRAGVRDDLGPAEAAVAELESRLASDPFRAPEADDLAALALGTREIAAAERAGRLLRLGAGVVLLPNAPALAMRELARLDQPFTTSGARQALGTTRRVAIPLLEHLDARGWTRRIDAGHREVVR